MQVLLLRAVRKVIISLRKKKKPTAKTIVPIKQEGHILCAESKWGCFVSLLVCETGLLPSTASPNQVDNKGERPEILWGHKCPKEMSWAHGFLNIFCQVSRIWDNNIKVNSSFLKRLLLIFIPGKWELPPPPPNILLCKYWGQIHLFSKLSYVSKLLNWQFLWKFCNILHDLK